MTKVYINGKFFDKADARVSVYDHGLLYGDGVFEGIRIYAGKVFRLREHLERLYASAKHIALEIPLPPEQMTEAVLRTVQVNNKKDGYIRLVVTRGAGSLGIDPRKTTDPQVIVIVDDISLYPPELYENGLEIVTSSFVRNHPNALEPRIKSLNYLNNILAKMEAVRAGCLEALMLNVNGEVAECTADNVFFVKRGVLQTPPTHAGILEGITRDFVMELAREAGDRGAGDHPDAARRLLRRRVLPDRHRRRDHPRREVRRPGHRRGQTGADHAAAPRAFSPGGATVTHGRRLRLPIGQRAEPRHRPRPCRARRGRRSGTEAAPALPGEINLQPPRSIRYLGEDRCPYCLTLADVSASFIGLEEEKGGQ